MAASSTPLSGATISSRAVVRAVYRGLVFFDENRENC